LNWLKLNWDNILTKKKSIGELQIIGKEYIDQFKEGELKSPKSINLAFRLDIS